MSGRYTDGADKGSETINDMKSDAGSEQIKAKERQRVIRQLNPHFIFNTLAAIRIVTKADSDLAYDMIYDFSKYLRVVFQSLTSYENISFREEADYVISYVNLMRLRFGDNITLYTGIEETDFMIPPLSLLPLVENAVIHGLKRGRRKGTVSIRSRQTLSEYIVQVEDDGIGFDAEAYTRTAIKGEAERGLQRVRYRIEQMTGGSVEVKSAVGSGTLITLHIPKNPRDT